MNSMDKELPCCILEAKTTWQFSLLSFGPWYLNSLRKPEKKIMSDSCKPKCWRCFSVLCLDFSTEKILWGLLWSSLCRSRPKIQLQWWHSSGGCSRELRKRVHRRSPMSGHLLPGFPLWHEFVHDSDNSYGEFFVNRLWGCWWKICLLGSGEFRLRREKMPMKVGSLLHSNSVLGVTPGFGFLTRLQSVLPTDLVLVDSLDTNPANPICHVSVKWFRNLESNRPDFKYHFHHLFYDLGQLTWFFPASVFSSFSFEKFIWEVNETV